MGLDYSLELSTSMKPIQALERLAGQIAGLTWSEDRFSVFGTGVMISAIEPRESWRETLEHGFHFVSTLSVGFRFVSDVDRDRLRSFLLQGTMLLLEHAQDAVLLFNGEHIILQRLGGQLAFNADSGIWRDENWLKSRITTPFERRSLPSPLL